MGDDNVRAAVSLRKSSSHSTEPMSKWLVGSSSSSRFAPPSIFGELQLGLWPPLKTPPCFRSARPKSPAPSRRCGPGERQVSPPLSTKRSLSSVCRRIRACSSSSGRVWDSRSVSSSSSLPWRAEEQRQSSLPRSRPFKIPAYMLLHIAESGIFGENDAAVVRNVFAVENLKQGGFPTAVDTHEADMLTFCISKVICSRIVSSPKLKVMSLTVKIAILGSSPPN